MRYAVISKFEKNGSDREDTFDNRADAEALADRIFKDKDSGIYSDTLINVWVEELNEEPTGY